MAETGDGPVGHQSGVQAADAGRQLTMGEWRVGLDFNPSGDPNVTKFKTLMAGFIDAVAEMHLASASPEHAAEQARLKALAITNAEDAAMWAVKAATKRPR